MPDRHEGSESVRTRMRRSPRSEARSPLWGAGWGDRRSRQTLVCRPVLPGPNSGGPEVSHPDSCVARGAHSPVPDTGPRGDVCWACEKGSSIFLGRMRSAHKMCYSSPSTHERLLYARAPGTGTVVSKGPCPCSLALIGGGGCCRCVIRTPTRKLLNVSA